MKTLISSLLFLLIVFSVSGQDLQRATTSGAVRLFGDKDDLTSVIMLIPAGSTVEIIKADIEYSLIRYDNSEGYVKSDKLAPQNVPDSPTPLVSQESLAASQTPLAAYQPADRFEMLTMKYGSTLGKSLYQHKIWKGATEEMARDSWGKPKQINRTYVDQSVEEEWIYTKKWLYFRDGVVIEWGPNK